MLLAHAADFARYKGSAEEYCARHYVDGRGHYNPAGNGFLAATLTPRLVSLMTPKPPAYRV
jgi:hypothetical protein